MALDDRSLLALVVLLALAVVLSLMAVLKRLPRRRPVIPAEIDSAFSFEPLSANQHRDFVFEVAGLITLTTGYATGIVRDPRLKGLELEVFKGIRRVGVVSIVPAGASHAIPARLRALAEYRAWRRVSKAYLVTGGAFSQEARRQARELSVALIDGAALEHMRLKTRQRPAPAPPVELPPLTEEEVAQWKPAAPGQRRVFKSDKGIARGAHVDYH